MVWWIMAAGALGTGARYLVGVWVLERFGAAFPYATIAVNLIGCFLLGMVTHLSAVPVGSPEVRAAVAIGLLGVLVRRNALIILMSVELMLNAANMTLLTFARMWGDLSGHTFALIVIAVAAAEAAVGLAIVVAVFRGRGNVDVDKLTALRH